MTAEWGSDQHKKQLRQLLEQKGIPGADTLSPNSTLQQRQASEQKESTPLQSPIYDDSYCLLDHGISMKPECDFGTRDDAIAMLRGLSPIHGNKHGRQVCRLSSLDSECPDSLPLALVQPAHALGQLEEALEDIMTRRQIPNRVDIYHHRMHSRSGVKSTRGAIPASGATSNIASTGPSTTARRSRRKSVKPAGNDAATTLSPGSGGAVDGKRSHRSRVSVASSEAPSFFASATAAYPELNSYMDKLTSSIAKLQANTTVSEAGPFKTTIISNQQQQKASVSHSRGGSIGDNNVSIPVTGSSAPPLPPSFCAIPPKLASHSSTTTTRLSTVAEDDGSHRPRSSSHASALSGSSAESRRRIVVNEVPSSSQFPNLFGTQLPENQPVYKPLSSKSPTVGSMSIYSGRTDSIFSHASSSNHSYNKHQQPSPMLGQKKIGHRPSGSSLEGVLGKIPLTAPPTMASSSTATSASTSKAATLTRVSNVLQTAMPAVTVREITPASRLALWITVQTTAEPVSKTTALWRRQPQWHKRFGIFAGNVLYLFKNSSPSATAMTMIRLNPTTIVCVNDSFQGRSWVIEITQPAPSAAPSPPSSSAKTLPPLSAATAGTSSPIGKPGSPSLSSSRSKSSLRPQSWYLQTEMRNEMVALLKQLKAAVGDLQKRPDMERKEEERLRSRRRKQRRAAKRKNKSDDVCPWEVDEFSDHGSDSIDENGEEEYSDSAYDDDDDDGDLGDDAENGGHNELMGNSTADPSTFFRIPDEDLFPSDDEGHRNYKHGGQDAYAMTDIASSSLATKASGRGDSVYTGTGGIAEWSAHRLHVPYPPMSAATGPAYEYDNDTMEALKMRSLSANPTTTTGSNSHRRPSLADALSPAGNNVGSSVPPPGIIRSRSTAAHVLLNQTGVRNSMMLKADATALIDQMFASASRDLSSASPEASVGPATDGNGLFVVREED